jgi:Trk K+ transport system NAD-binding subunit
MNNKNLFYIIISKLRQPIIALIVIYSVGILGMKVITGTDLNDLPYQLTFFEAFYIVSYTSTTIGFGETPYPWNDNQKMFMLFFIYSSVICWIWAINSIITILRDKEMERIRERYRIESRVKKLQKPFYIIAGVDETGHEVAKILTHHGYQVVAIDKDELKVDELRMYDYDEEVFSYNGDINDIDNLKICGIEHECCKGIIVSTGDDHTNWYTSTTARILNSKLKIVAVTVNKETQETLNSIHIDHIVSPYDHFANELIQAIQNPSHNMLRVLVTNETFDHYKEINPKKGLWLIFGYEKIGQVLLHQLKEIGNDVILIDTQEPGKEICESENITYINSINFNELKDRVDFKNVKGVISSFEDDLKNLSVLIKIKEINKEIFTVVYENQLKNKELYNKLNIDLVVQKQEMATRKIYYIISEPLLGEFLKRMSNQPEKINRSVVNQLKNKKDDSCIETWHININKDEAYGIYDLIKSGEYVKIKNITQTKKGKITPLLIKRKNKYILLPNEEEIICFDDEILFAGSFREYKLMMWLVHHPNILDEHLN